MKPKPSELGVLVCLHTPNPGLGPERSLIRNRISGLPIASLLEKYQNFLSRMSPVGSGRSQILKILVFDSMSIIFVQISHLKMFLVFKVLELKM
jgi:hypothetical protein